MTQTTYMAKAGEVTSEWYIVDARGQTLGRLAVNVARVLRGKHRPQYTPHQNTGDHVIVINASKVVLTANKGEQSFSYRHSGYPGSLRATSYGDLLQNKPEELMRSAVRGMLPKGTLGRKMLTKLKVYSGAEHPHAAQMPKPMALPASAARRIS